MKRTENSINNEPDKVWVQVETTINLGNYENIKLAAGISHTLLPKEDPFDTRLVLMEQLRKDLLEEAEEYRK